jgi:hypothetical protein
MNQLVSTKKDSKNGIIVSGLLGLSVCLLPQNPEQIGIELKGIFNARKYLRSYTIE